MAEQGSPLMGLNGIPMWSFFKKLNFCFNKGFLSPRTPRHHRLGRTRGKRTLCFNPMGIFFKKFFFPATRPKSPTEFNDKRFEHKFDIDTAKAKRRNRREAKKM